MSTLGGVYPISTQVWFTSVYCKRVLCLTFNIIKQ